MGATNILNERRRKPLKRATVQRMADVYRERFANEDGRLRASFEIIWLSETLGRPRGPAEAAQARLGDAPTFRRPEYGRNIDREKPSDCVRAEPSGEQSAVRRPEAFRTLATCSALPR